MTMHQG